VESKHIKMHVTFFLPELHESVCFLIRYWFKTKSPQKGVFLIVFVVVRDKFRSCNF
jgi:hypothetical protein